MLPLVEKNEAISTWLGPTLNCMMLASDTVLLCQTAPEVSTIVVASQAGAQHAKRWGSWYSSGGQSLS